MDTCVFCKMINKEITPQILWEDDEHFIFLDRQPVKSGHTLVIPKKHVDYVFDLEDEDYSKLFLAAKKFGKILKEATGAKRVGVVVEGFGVSHVHIHLIPLHEGESLVLREDILPTEEELSQIAQKIRGCL